MTRSFDRISAMEDGVLAKDLALEERTKDAKEAARAKSMFLANISYGIRTPINAILGFCHLLQRPLLEPRQGDQVRKIGSGDMALLRLVNDIVGFSKNEAGRLTLETREFDLRNALLRQVQMMAKTISAKGLNLQVELDATLPAVLIGDELRLNQIVLNLLGNALKFTTEGRITLKARMINENDGVAMIECSVGDTGLGMTPVQQSRLFLPFTQADSFTTRRFGAPGWAWPSASRSCSRWAAGSARTARRIRAAPSPSACR
ncbi:histidine kinase dimerization/phospho-acceptor domain-containing protein [Paracoccus sp. (in: a-proteobacteria)]|uniref:histidine kinase dimerization/phospho-acceptor domain-containing protein n=1 Tax=Paracoccus sp. TaxID=267 RepID=UPI00396C8023